MSDEERLDLVLSIIDTMYAEDPAMSVAEDWTNDDFPSVSSINARLPEGAANVTAAERDAAMAHRALRNAQDQQPEAIVEPLDVAAAAPTPPVVPRNSSTPKPPPSGL